MIRIYRKIFFGYFYLIINFLLLLLLFQQQANAQMQGTENESQIKIKSNGLLMSPKKMGKHGATVTTTSADLEVAYEIGNANLQVMYAASEYQWKKINKLPFGNGKDNPWNMLQRIGALLGYHGTIKNRWGYFMGAYTGLSYENEVDNAFNILGYGGITRALGSECFVKAGVGYKYHRVQSFVFPVVGINYVSKSIAGLEANLEFPFTSVSYKFNKWIGLRIFGNYEYGMYALRKKSPVASEGFMEIYGYRSGAYVDLWPAETFQFSIGCVYDFEGYYVLYNSHGSRIKRYECGDGLGGALKLDLSF